MSAKNINADQRVAKRKTIEGISVKNITTTSKYSKIAKKARLVDASSSGFLVEIHRDEILPKELRGHLTLDSLIGENLTLEISEMNLDLGGTIIRSNYKGNSLFELAIDYSSDAPEYWRECLMDLLPEPGEMDE